MSDPFKTIQLCNRIKEACSHASVNVVKTANTTHNLGLSAHQSLAIALLKVFDIEEEKKLVKPNIVQIANVIASLSTAIVMATRGSSEVVQHILTAHNSFGELIEICALNNIEFVYKGKEK